MNSTKRRGFSLLVVVVGAILAGASWREIAPIIYQVMTTGETAQEG